MNTIISITSDGLGGCVCVTADDHGLVGKENIIFTKTGNDQYDGRNAIVQEILNPRAFTFLLSETSTPTVPFPGRWELHEA